MALTPVDILHTQFKTVIRGYNKNQVDEFLRAAGESLEAALRDKADLQHKVDALQDEVDQVRQIKTALTDALTVAQQSADELRANAHKQAELILQEAEQSRVRLVADVQAEAEKCRTEIALLQATRDRFETELRSMLAGYTEWLERRRPEELARSEVA
jgi:cell division initiation protein